MERTFFTKYPQCICDGINNVETPLMEQEQIDMFYLQPVFLKHFQDVLWNDSYRKSENCSSVHFKDAIISNRDSFMFLPIRSKEKLSCLETWFSSDPGYCSPIPKKRRSFLVVKIHDFGVGISREKQPIFHSMGLHEGLNYGKPVNESRTSEGDVKCCTGFRKPEFIMDNG